MCLFKDTAATEIYTLSLHDALPIYFFKGYPGFSMLVAKVGGVPAHPANVHRLLADEQELVLVFPEGRKGTEKLYKDRYRSEEHTSELQSRQYLVCRLLLEKKKTTEE